MKSEDVSFDVSFLFGGQIKGSRMRLFMVYTAGNFIECTTDTPYLQIGEHKYGKPVLDRAMHYDVELYEALKTGLISMDSTMRSNLGVGLPIDVLVVRADACEADLNHRIEAGEPYFHDLRSRWSAALRAAHQNIPRPPYKNETEAKTRIRGGNNGRSNTEDRHRHRRGHRRRARGIAGADERRLYRGARRAPHGDAARKPRSSATIPARACASPPT